MFDSKPGHAVQDGPLAQSAVEALDALAILVHPDWTDATITFAGAQREFRIASLKTATPAGKPVWHHRDGRLCNALGSESEQLDFEMGKWTAIGSHAFGVLAERVNQQGFAWDGSALRCRRSALQNQSIWLENQDQRLVLEIRAGQGLSRGELITRDLLSHLASSQAAWRRKRAILREFLGQYENVSFLPDEQLLSFESGDRSKLVLRSTILGSYSSEELTWCWAWANSGLLPRDYEAIQGFRDRSYQYAGMGAFWRPGFFSDEALCLGVAHLAAEENGAWGVFAMRINEHLTRFYAIWDAVE